ncbi:MAG TPA: hypothetical protein VK898_03485, partial [Chloroflexota bacterium]|nr:hypothetical protein [Chloroflexota bacterium]
TLDMLVLLGFGLVGAVDVAIMLGLLLSALACSVAVALLLALLARDFRTANNINGALLGPVILAVLGVLFGLPTPLSYIVLAAVLLAAAAAAVQVGLRWLTFERYLARHGVSLGAGPKVQWRSQAVPRQLSEAGAYEQHTTFPIPPLTGGWLRGSRRRRLGRRDRHVQPSQADGGCERAH